MQNQTCPNCKKTDVTKEHTCTKDDGSDFVLSMIIGAATDSAILGSIIGGDVGGAIIGDVLDGDLFD